MRFAKSTMALVLVAAIAGGSVSAGQLADAVERRDDAVVASLLADGASVNAAQADGMTPLHWATWHDDVELARRLLQAGSDPRAANRYGVRPLSIACQNGNSPLVELLLQHGADPNTSLPGGESVLMTAARTGRLGPVDSLLSRGAYLNDRGPAGQTAMMWAAAAGHADVVAAMLENGGEFNTPLPSGFTPFFFAVREGHREVVRRLLEAGCDVNAVMRPDIRDGRSPRDGTAALMLAVENGHFRLAVDLLAAGADPNDQRSGFTPLHAMTWVRKPNRGDGVDGDPPPDGSGDLGSLPFVRQLVAWGADVNARLHDGRSGRGRLNQEGATPILMAAKTADVPLLKLLVDLGGDPLIPNVDGATPLMAAAGLGTLAPSEEAGSEDEAVAAVEFLLQLGGDVNRVDANGETAMHGAAYKNLPQVVQLLADNGAEIAIWNRKNRYRWTPLRIAQGHRPGNFKPSPETVAALHRVMRAAGVTPPMPKPRRQSRVKRGADRE